MTDRNLSIDLERLSSQGFAEVSGLLSSENLEALETDIREFAEQKVADMGIARRHPEALWDLFLHDKNLRKSLFPLLKYSYSIQQQTAEIARRLKQSGYFEAWGFQSPLTWCNLRVDLPGEDLYLLPMHQDIRSTECQRAFRLWIPLRGADHQKGTIRVVPGSHLSGIMPHDDMNHPNFGPGIHRSEFDSDAEHRIELSVGDGIIFDPQLVHGSVPATGDALKIVLLIQIQDLATFVDPERRTTISEGRISDARALRRDFENGL